MAVQQPLATVTHTDYVAVRCLSVLVVVFLVCAGGDVVVTTSTSLHAIVTHLSTLAYRPFSHCDVESQLVLIMSNADQANTEAPRERPRLILKPRNEAAAAQLDMERKSSSKVCASCTIV